MIYVICLSPLAYLWFRDGLDAWKRRRVVKRAVRDLDLELDMLA